MRFILFTIILTVLGACKTQTIQFPSPVNNISIGMKFKELFIARPGIVIVNSVVETPYREFQQMINENSIKEIHFYIDKTAKMKLYEVKLWFDSPEQAATMAKNYFGKVKKGKDQWSAQTSEGTAVFLSLKNSVLTVSSKESNNSTSSAPTE